MSMMTMRERMLAFYQGKPFDQVPFIQYDNIAGPNKDIWDVVGRNNMGLLRWTTIHGFIHPNCRYERQLIHEPGLKGFKTVLNTPVGTLTEISYYDPVYGSKVIRKHFIESEEDYEVFRYFLKDITVVDNDEAFVKTWYQLGDDGLPMVQIQRTPFQQLWIQWVSLADLSLHMVDIPDIMEEIIQLLADIGRRVFDIVYKAVDRLPIPFVNIPDNITAPTIGVSNFRKYALPMYKEFVEMMDFKNIPVVVHMDGDLKPLWNSIGESGIFGIDSFSPPPDNDTSVAQAFSMWPDIRIMANFPSSVHLSAAELVYEKAKQLLEEGGHTGRFWIQVSENVPPNAWKNSYPGIVKAIKDFGRP